MKISEMIKRLLEILDDPDYGDMEVRLEQIDSRDNLFTVDISEIEVKEYDSDEENSESCVVIY